MSFDKITETDSNYDKLDEKSIKELLEIINSEDQTVAFSVKKEISKIYNTMEENKNFSLSDTFFCVLKTVQ